MILIKVRVKVRRYMTGTNDYVIEYHDSDGNTHRIGGPAIDYLNGAKSWFEHGVYLKDNFRDIF